MACRQYSIIEGTEQSLKEKFLYLTVAAYEKDWHSLPHTHSFCELFYITDGSGDFFVNDKRYPVKRNHFIIVNPNILHTEKSSVQHPLSYYALGIDNLSFILEDDRPASGCSIYDFSRYRQNILPILELMREEVQQKKENYKECLQSFLEILLIRMSRILEHSSINNSMDETACFTTVSRECLLIKEYIDKNYCEKITLDTLAQIVHKNRYYVSRSYSENFGVSPMHYLQERRILAAKDLLTTSNYGINQIANMIGFSTPVYFTQIFKQNTGISPREFRKLKLLGH